MAVTNYYSIDGQMIGYKDTNGRKDFLTDNLGSVTGEIDQTGTNRTFDGRYRPYGNSLWSTGTRGAFGWIGTWGYRITGLNASTHYVRERHFSEATGIWTTIDTLWPDQTKYLYVDQKSTLFIDFTGLAPNLSSVCDHYLPKDQVTRANGCLSKLCSGLDDPTKFKKIVDCMKGKIKNPESVAACLRDKLCKKANYLITCSESSNGPCALNSKITCQFPWGCTVKNYTVPIPSNCAETACKGFTGTTICTYTYTTLPINCPWSFPLGPHGESPRCGSEKGVAVTVIHELIHACGDCSTDPKHSPDFNKVASCIINTIGCNK